jgi:hypothetical protein
LRRGLGLPARRKPVVSPGVPAASDPLPTLILAIEALRRREREAGLEALIEAWRSTRASAIAQLVDALSQQLEAERPPLALGGASKQEAWNDALEQAVTADLPRLYEAPLTAARGVELAAGQTARSSSSWPGTAGRGRGGGRGPRPTLASTRAMSSRESAISTRRMRPPQREQVMTSTANTRASSSSAPSTS